MARWKALLGVAVVPVLLAACGGGTFRIDEFRASSGCSATGTMEILASGQVRSVGDIQYQFSSAGGPSAWCEGLVHRWPDGGEIEGYIFASDPNDPLEFTVEAAAYTYRGGTGTVTSPDGDTTDLP